MFVLKWHCPLSYWLWLCHPLEFKCGRPLCCDPLKLKSVYINIQKAKRPTLQHRLMHTAWHSFSNEPPVALVADRSSPTPWSYWPPGPPSPWRSWSGGRLEKNHLWTFIKWSNHWYMIQMIQKPSKTIINDRLNQGWFLDKLTHQFQEWKLKPPPKTCCWIDVLSVFHRQNCCLQLPELQRLVQDRLVCDLRRWLQAALELCYLQHIRYNT